MPPRYLATQRPPATNSELVPSLVPPRLLGPSLRFSAHGACPRPGRGVSALSSIFSFRPSRAWQTVHFRQRDRRRLFTHPHPSPKLPARPSCDCILDSNRSCAHLLYLFSSPVFFFL